MGRFGRVVNAAAVLAVPSPQSTVAAVYPPESVSLNVPRLSVVDVEFTGTTGETRWKPTSFGGSMTTLSVVDAEAWVVLALSSTVTV